MKKNLHPTVRQVVFKDVSSDFPFLGTSMTIPNSVELNEVPDANRIQSNCSQ
jgi:ribosomal protein L31